MSGRLMQCQALQQTKHKAYPIGAIGCQSCRSKVGVDLHDFLKQDSDGADRMPQYRSQPGVILPLFTQLMKSLPLFRCVPLRAFLGSADFLSPE